MLSFNGFFVSGYPVANIYVYCNTHYNKKILIYLQLLVVNFITSTKMLAIHFCCLFFIRLWMPCTHAYTSGKSHSLHCFFFTNLVLFPICCVTLISVLYSFMHLPLQSYYIGFGPTYVIKHPFLKSKSRYEILYLKTSRSIHAIN